MRTLFILAGILFITSPLFAQDFDIQMCSLCSLKNDEPDILSSTQLKTVIYIDENALKNILDEPAKPLKDPAGPRRMKKLAANDSPDYKIDQYPVPLIGGNVKVLVRKKIDFEYSIPILAGEIKLRSKPKQAFTYKISW